MKGRVLREGWKRHPRSGAKRYNEPPDSIQKESDSAVAGVALFLYGGTPKYN